MRLDTKFHPNLGDDGKGTKPARKVQAMHTAPEQNFTLRHTGNTQTLLTP